MRTQLLWVVAVGVLLLGSPASADPITISGMRLAQITLGPPPSVTVAPVGVGLPPPTFHSLSQVFVLLTDFSTVTVAPLTLVTVAPLGTVESLLAPGVDMAAVGFSIPRVFTPTLFTADVELRDAAGTVLAQEQAQWFASSPVPEPGTLALVALGLGVLAAAAYPSAPGLT